MRKGKVQLVLLSTVGVIAMLVTLASPTYSIVATFQACYYYFCGSVPAEGTIVSHGVCSLSRETASPLTNQLGMFTANLLKSQQNSSMEIRNLLKKAEQDTKRNNSQYQLNSTFYNLVGTIYLPLFRDNREYSGVIRCWRARALIITNYEYLDVATLRSLHKAALSMREALAAESQFDYIEIKSNLPTVTKMLTAVRNFSATLGPSDFVMVYYSGLSKRVNEREYLLPTNVSPSLIPQDIINRALPLVELSNALWPAKLRLLVLDTATLDTATTSSISLDPKNIKLTTVTVSRG